MIILRKNLDSWAFSMLQGFKLLQAIRKIRRFCKLGVAAQKSLDNALILSLFNRTGAVD
ncbi:hypothetical protein D3C71_2233870 [compost metagenome]